MRAVVLSAAAASLAGGCAYFEPEGPWLAEDAALKAREAAAFGATSARQVGEAAVAGARMAHREATGPHLSPMGYTPTPEAAEDAATASSLWRPGARSFFNDQRASRVGDILTVVIEIDDSASVSNSTSRSRSGSASAGISALGGQERLIGRLLPPGGAAPFDAGNLVDAEGESTAQGQGQIERTEQVTLTVAAVVSDVLPNGNFVISGRQEVRINAEVRDLTVEGIIRPEDIASDNTIRHIQIAEARIAYGGRGVISTVQRPRWGQRIVDAVSPW